MSCLQHALVTCPTFVLTLSVLKTELMFLFFLKASKGTRMFSTWYFTGWLNFYQYFTIWNEKWMKSISLLKLIEAFVNYYSLIHKIFKAHFRKSGLVMKDPMQYNGIAWLLVLVSLLNITVLYCSNKRYLFEESKWI